MPVRQIYNVTQLNTAIRRLIETDMGQVWLSGELSNFKAYPSGHWYFSLRDDKSQVNCAMFRGKNAGVTFRPRDGQQLLVRARPTVYEPRGSYQLVVEFMEPAGDGLLKQQFEALKMKLAAEGLFSDASKRPLPPHPKRVGVITSPRGAAFHDILNVLKRRAPFLEVILYPAQVQGDGAAPQLVQQLQSAAERDEVDVLILGRGGGSLEDLWCFNDEALARAIYDSPIPVVSAVGHETDVTISDFVADLRAPTPSAAAELVSARAASVGERLAELGGRLGPAFERLNRARLLSLGALAHRLGQQHPGRRLERDGQRLDELQGRLTRLLQQRLDRAGNRRQELARRLDRQHPRQLLAQGHERLVLLEERLAHGLARRREHWQHRLALAAGKLNTVSPLATLARGYAIAQDEKGQVVDSVNRVQPGERLQIRVQDGQILTRVEEPTTD
ncbi:exodeoxyribonuclease VII large subunit [Gallaecimonas sp. GXIMD4217]|uniref:exodeoxyribonuclease VII large subunit n=1 Tax=Gallaecimonas sp. GXIMD4217 TaxID=3131927 RepID=UPI00311B1F21